MSFETSQVSYQLVTSLYYSYCKAGKLSIFDIGGSLGSTYYQSQSLFQKEFYEYWNVIEQNHYVELGKKDYTDEKLKFISVLPKSLGSNSFIILSSVLQFLEHPFKLLEQITRIGAKYVLIDKTPISTDGRNYLSIQKVYPPIYDASYPAWHLSEREILKAFLNYQNIDSFNSHIGVVNQTIHFSSTYKGYFFVKNDWIKSLSRKNIPIENNEG